MRTGRRQATRRQGDEQRGLPRALLRGALWVSVGVPLLAGSVFGAQRLMDPATFPVRTVKVTGEFRYLKREQLEAAVMPGTGNGLLRVNVEKVRAAVEALPWVARAQVRRLWPEGLEVAVEEQRPLARWGAGGW